MKKNFILLLLVNFYLLSFSGTNEGQSNNLHKDSISNYLDKIDSLTFNWYVNHPYIDYTNIYTTVTDSNNIEYPDSVYLQRIKDIPSVVPLTYNKIVKNFIKVYTVKRREKVQEMLGLSEFYFPMFEQILDEMGMPIELKYLSIIESALNPRALSKAGASGLWQFMYYTAKPYKLRMNSYVDERRDPIKSTYAAANFLKDLYEIYNDWILVIAAYNCGPGNVNKAIRRAGNKHDYWQIYYYLPRETRGYVPAYIAATYVFNYHQQHNLYPKKINYSVLTDTLIIHDELHLRQVSEVLNIPHEDVLAMNPQYRKEIIPKDVKNGYILKLPIEYVSDFIQLKDSIFSYNDAEYFNPKNITAKPSYYSKYSPVTPAGYSKLYYTVKQGDNLGFISEWYHVRPSDIRYWNNIRGNLIRSGQKVVIFIPKSKVNKYKSINQMTFAEKQRSVGKVIASNNTGIKNDSNGETVYYKVKSGDSLWEIAKSYPGVSDYDIMKMNNIKNARSISPGQTLKIIKVN